ncbi:MAG: GNAT family protein [Bryobacteraceae bacterium]
MSTQPVFGEIGLHRGEIRRATGNTRSCAIPQRLAFTPEGVLREAEWVNPRWLDLAVWSMLEQDWRRRDHAPAAPAMHIDQRTSALNSSL